MPLWMMFCGGDGGFFDIKKDGAENLLGVEGSTPSDSIIEGVAVSRGWRGVLLSLLPVLFAEARVEVAPLVHVRDIGVEEFPELGLHLAVLLRGLVGACEGGVNEIAVDAAGYGVVAFATLAGDTAEEPVFLAIKDAPALRATAS